MKNEIQYSGRVLDRLTGKTVYKSRGCSTWGEAYSRASRHAIGVRYAIVMEYEEPKKAKGGAA